MDVSLRVVGELDRQLRSFQGVVQPNNQSADVASDVHHDGASSGDPVVRVGCRGDGRAHVHPTHGNGSGGPRRDGEDMGGDIGGLIVRLDDSWKETELPDRADDPKEDVHTGVWRDTGGQTGCVRYPELHEGSYRYMGQGSRPASGDHRGSGCQQPNLVTELPPRAVVSSRRRRHLHSKVPAIAAALSSSVSTPHA